MNIKPTLRLDLATGAKKNRDVRYKQQMESRYMLFIGILNIEALIISDEFHR